MWISILVKGGQRWWADAARAAHFLKTRSTYKQEADSWIISGKRELIAGLLIAKSVNRGYQSKAGFFAHANKCK
jgi:hypothetical protein